MAAAAGAAALFACAGALVSTLGVFGLTACAVMSMTVGVALLATSVLCGADRSQVPWKLLSLIALLDVLQAGL